MDGNKAPDLAIGAVSNDGDPVVLYLRSKPTIALKPISTLKPLTGPIQPKDSGHQIAKNRAQKNRPKQALQVR